MVSDMDFLNKNMDKVLLNFPEEENNTLLTRIAIALEEIAKNTRR